MNQSTSWRFRSGSIFCSWPELGWTYELIYVAFAELELRTNKCKPDPLLPGIVTDLGLVKNRCFPAMRFLQSSRLTSIHPFSDQLWHLLALLQGFRGGFRTGHHQGGARLNRQVDQLLPKHWVFGSYIYGSWCLYIFEPNYSRTPANHSMAL